MDFPMDLGKALPGPECFIQEFAVLFCLGIVEAILEFLNLLVLELQDFYGCHGSNSSGLTSMGTVWGDREKKNILVSKPRPF